MPLFYLSDLEPRYPDIRPHVRRADLPGCNGHNPRRNCAAERSRMMARMPTSCPKITTRIILRVRDAEPLDSTSAFRWWERQRADGCRKPARSNSRCIRRTRDIARTRRKTGQGKTGQGEGRNVKLVFTVRSGPPEPRERLLAAGVKMREFAGFPALMCGGVDREGNVFRPSRPDRCGRAPCRRPSSAPPVDRRVLRVSTGSGRSEGFAPASSLQVKFICRRAGDGVHTAQTSKTARRQARREDQPCSPHAAAS
jgi:hypothetical protein